MTQKNITWPEITDSECISIEKGDVLIGDGYIIANEETLSAIGDGSCWRVVGTLQPGEDLEAALDRIEREVNY
jgi:hypothetical protein